MHSAHTNSYIALQAETDLVSVERVTEYSEMPREGAHNVDVSTEGQDPWEAASRHGRRGLIKLRNLRFSYSPTGVPAVLHGITTTIPAGTKLAVVGRTGAGKSTIMVHTTRTSAANSAIASHSSALHTLPPVMLVEAVPLPRPHICGRRGH